MCDSSIFSTPKWIRFSGAGGTQLATSFPGANRCGTYYPGFLNDTHPVGAGETKISSVCFGYSGGCDYRNTISVTNCLSYFVYYLIPPPTCNLRYCSI
jgi:hypothetical protein